MILWANVVPAFQPKVDEHTKYLLRRYDAYLAHRSVPESTHEELLNSNRPRGNQGIYDLITLHPGFSDVETYCMEHAEAGKEREFFKNRTLKKIRQCKKRMLSNSNNSTINNRGGDDDDVG